MTSARILIAQDDTALAERTQNPLQHARYDIPAAVPSGEEVIRMTGQHRPDLVLMDIKKNHAIDAVAIVRHIVSLFENYGYTVIEAIGGEDAITMFQEHQNFADLLILDVVTCR